MHHLHVLSTLQTLEQQSALSTHASSLNAHALFGFSGFRGGDPKQSLGLHSHRVFGSAKQSASDISSQHLPNHGSKLGTLVLQQYLDGIGAAH